MKNRMLIVLSLLALVRVASADILVVRNQGNGPVPLKSAPLVFGPVEVAKAETNGVARITFTWDGVFKKTMADIKEARDAMGLLMEKNFIKKPDIKLLEDAVKKAVDAVK